MYSFQGDSLALFGDTKSQSLGKQSACQAVSLHQRWPRNLQLISVTVEPYLNIVNTSVAL